MSQQNELVPADGASGLESSVVSEDAKKSCKNMTARQREWIFASIVVAKDGLQFPMNNVLEGKAYLFACEKLKSWAEFTTLTQIPSEKSMRLMWKNYWSSTGSLNSKAKTAGRRKKDIDSDIQAILAINPAATARYISRELGVSHVTVYRRMKSAPRELGKRGAPRKTKGKHSVTTAETHIT